MNRRSHSFLLVLVMIMISGPQVAAGSVDARSLFDRLQSLAGDWNGSSTEGWTGTLSVRLIARGSVVVSTSTFDAHPGETMITVYHLDGDRLVLTHYCVAKNQPRLEATEWDPKTGAARFEFFDGTNLESRDQGHMDSVVVHFVDEDHFSSRWTWYQDGEERWLEDITWERTE